MPEVVAQGQTVVGIMPGAQPDPASLTPELEAVAAEGVSLELLAAVQRELTNMALTVKPAALATQLANKPWLATISGVDPEQPRPGHCQSPEQNG